MVTSAFASSHVPLERFWLPSGRSYGLDQYGWLRDPEKTDYSGIVRTRDLVETQCLILLGEPGMGKSTIASSKNMLVTEDAATQILTVNLASYSSEERLERKVFDGPEVTNWRKSDKKLCLTLDSFDEAHTRIENLHQLLGEYLASWDCSRLVLRIFCRTAEWPTSLERILERQFEEVVPHELLPLRRQDAAAIVANDGVDPDEFLAAVEMSQAVPLASRPLSLRLLVNTFKKEESLPRQSAELYSKGLLALCEEMNPERRDAARASSFRAKARLDMASRMAAFSVFGSRPTFWQGPSQDAESEDLTVEECIVSHSSIGGPTSDETSADTVVGVLSTGIFSGSGSQRRAWSHITFADFLTARWIVEHKLNKTQVTSLLVSDSNKLHPRVRQVAAWLVAMAPDFGWLIELDPTAFLLNIEIPEVQLREVIVSGVLAEARSGKWRGDYHWNFSMVRHPRLEEQLRGALEGDSTEASRVAIDIARDCGMQALVPQLVDIALNEEADLYLRVPAAWTVCELSKEAPTNALLPLVEPTPKTPDSISKLELQATGLIASWPHAIATADIFPLLHPQYPKNYFGLYSIFLNRFAESLTATDLEPACSWLSSNERHLTNPRLTVLVDAIFALCLQLMDRPHAVRTVSMIVWRRVQNLEPLFRREGANGLTELPAEARTTIAQCVLRQCETELVGLLTMPGTALISGRDLGWLMDEYADASGDFKRNLAQAIRLVFDPEDQSHSDRMRRLPEGHPAATLIVDWREGDDARKVHEIETDIKNKRKALEEERAANDQFVSSRIEELLPQAKRGNPDAFWQVARYITVPPADGFFRDEHQPDLTKHPRWETLSADCRKDVIAGAGLYLVKGACNPEVWVGKGNRHYPADAGYIALTLLLKTSPDELRRLEPSVWREWAPIIVGWQVMPDEDSMRDRFALIKRALPHARRELTDAALQLVDAAIQGGTRLSLSEELIILSSHALTEELLGRLRSRIVPVNPLAELIGVLAETAPAAIHQLLIEWLHPEQRQAHPARARTAALHLLSSDDSLAWQTLSKLMESDVEFTKEVFLQITSSDGKRCPSFGDAEIAQLYVWLLKNFPPGEDLRFSDEEVRFIEPREVVATWRDNLVEALARRGSEESVAKIKEIIETHSDDLHREYVFKLERLLELAEHARLDNSWQPLTPEQLGMLAASADSRVVLSERDLFEASLEALKKVQERLQGDTPSSQLLWDTYSKRPKSEDEFSDYLRTELRSLMLAQGAIVNREVQVRRALSAGAPERTDIRIDAVTRGADARVTDQITIVGEVKGSWNKDIFTSIKSQLVDRYMADLHTSYGIYIVAWFDLESWGREDDWKKDSRRPMAARHQNIAQLHSNLKKEAALLEGAGLRRIEVVVLDVSLPRPKQ